MYVYKKSETLLWTVGYYDPDGKWEPESDHEDKHEARKRVNFLNGGAPPVETFKAVAEAADRVVDAYSDTYGIHANGGPQGVSAIEALRDTLGRI